MATMATGSLSDDEAMLMAGDEKHVVTHQPDPYSPSPNPPAYSSAPYQHPPSASSGMAMPLGMMASAPYPGFAPMSHTSHNTTVIINQPGLVERGPRVWSSSLCSCCDNMGSCLLGTFCPCILASQIAMDMEESCCVPCCVPGWLIVLRAKLRAENNIQGTVMDDCCTVCCCGQCVMCQMARELKFIRNSYRPSQ